MAIRVPQDLFPGRPVQSFSSFASRAIRSGCGRRRRHQSAPGPAHRADHAPFRPPSAWRSCRAARPNSRACCWWRVRAAGAGAVRRQRAGQPSLGSRSGSTRRTARDLRFPAHEPAWPQSRLSRNRSSRRCARATSCCTTPSRASIRSCSSSAKRSRIRGVLAIKQTIYRTGTESVLMDLLIAPCSVRT